MGNFSWRQSFSVQLQQKCSILCAVRILPSRSAGYENAHAVFVEFRDPAAGDAELVRIRKLCGLTHHSHMERYRAQSGAIHSGHVYCRTIRSHSPRPLFDPRECQSAAITESCEPSDKPWLSDAV